MLCTINALLVRTSQGLAAAGLSRRSSYGPSMRRNGLPGRQNVHRCVRVTTMDCAALRAHPFPHAQRKPFNDVSAVRAGLRGREPAVDLDHGLAVPLCLLFDHADGHSDGSVAHRAGQAVVFDHAAQIEVFDADHIETCNEIGAQLVQRVAAAVADLLVDAGDVAFDARPALASLGAAGETLLIERQAALPLRTVLRVTDALPVGERRQSRHTEVNADRLAGLGQWDRRRINDQRDEVFAARGANQANRGRMRDRLARPLDLDRTDLGQLQNLALDVEREAPLGVVRRLPRLLALEARVGGALVEEVREGCL